MVALGYGPGLAALLHRGARDAIDQAVLTGPTLHARAPASVLSALDSFFPAPGWTAVLAIFAHEAPAGYLLVGRLDRAGRLRALMGCPALATGLGALSVAMMRVVVSISGGLMFGIAAGLFLFVSLSFLRDGARFEPRDGGYWLAGLIGGTLIALTGRVLSVGADRAVFFKTLQNFFGRMPTQTTATSK